MSNCSCCRVIRITVGVLLLLLPILACAPGGQVGLDNENRVFPPDRLLPLRLAIATPLVPFSHAAGHQALIDWDESPGQRRLLMNCTWKEGLRNFVRIMVPGTEIFYLGAGRDPLAAVSSPALTETDTLGTVKFSLNGRSALDVARHRGWTHLVVPEHLEYQLTDAGKDLALISSAAIIDVQEQRIVWQGVIDSRRVSAKELGSKDSLQPALTAYETTTYCYILDLVQILNRQLNAKPQSRHQLASPCQDPPPLLRDMD